MAQLTLTLEVRLRWWLRAYLTTLGMLCRLFNSEPDWERVAFWCSRGCQWRIGRGRWRNMPLVPEDFAQ